jgi:hypothetical protein
VKLTKRRLVGLSLALLPIISAQADTLFYNGTPDAAPGFANFLDCANCRSAAGVKVYDDFNVSPGGWTVTGLFGNYLMFSSAPLPVLANWEIHQGITQGNGGTLIASGTAAVAPTPISTPPNGDPSYSYAELNVNIAPLALATGTYWMTLAPFSNLNETYLVGTDGANGVNALIDGLSFINGASGGTSFNWQNVGSYEKPFTGYNQYDFSYGVIGTGTLNPTPEPSFRLLLSLCAGAIYCAAGYVRRSRSV